MLAAGLVRTQPGLIGRRDFDTTLLAVAQFFDRTFHVFHFAAEFFELAMHLFHVLTHFIDTALPLRFLDKFRVFCTLPICRSVDLAFNCFGLVV